MTNAATLTNLDAIRQEKARRHLVDFLEWDGQGEWQRAKHLELLCSTLEAVEYGDIRFLLITMPPRHGKSETSSKKFPAYYLGRHPEREMIISSYAADLAHDLSQVARDTLEQRGPELWGVTVNDDSSAKGRWGTATLRDKDGEPLDRAIPLRGGLFAAGVGGPITGRGAHIALIDDPFKNWEEAASKTRRENVWNWYRSTLRTRLAPKGAIILIQTRWHDDDLAGKLLEQDKDKGRWHVLNLPAEAEDNDPLGRQPGEPLWPERYDKQALQEAKDDVGSYLYSAMFQQTPRPSDGAIFTRSWFRYFVDEADYYVMKTPTGEQRVEKRKCMTFQTVDTAATENQQSDYFVIGTWAVTPDRELLLLDIQRERAETTKHEAMMEQSFQRWHPRYQGIENKTFGLNLIQGLRRKGLPVKPIKADTDKVSRARPMAARYEVGAVYHRQGAPWLQDYEDELIAFPKGEHDDQVDVASMAGLEVAMQKKVSAVDKPTGW